MDAWNFETSSKVFLRNKITPLKFISYHVFINLIKMIGKN